MKNYTLLKRVILATALCASVALSLPLRASADDASDIQAAITAYLQQQQVQSAGVFASYLLIESYPYASVQVLLGTQGNGAEAFALSKTSGNWTILGNGGGVMSASEFIGYGIPAANAKALQGFSCATEPRRPGQVRKVRATRVSPSLRRLALLRGPSVLPSRKVNVYFRGRIKSVTIIQPLSTRECLL
jgi:hypothetical protein